jgi:hypothetical protein
MCLDMASSSNWRAPIRSHDRHSGKERRWGSCRSEGARLATVSRARPGQQATCSSNTSCSSASPSPIGGQGSRRRDGRAFVGAKMSLGAPVTPAILKGSEGGRRQTFSPRHAATIVRNVNGASIAGSFSGRNRPPSKPGHQSLRPVVPRLESFRTACSPQTPPAMLCGRLVSAWREASVPEAPVWTSGLK